MLSLQTFSLTVCVCMSFILFTVCFIVLAILKAGMWFIDEINEQITWRWTDPGCYSTLDMVLVQMEQRHLGCSRSQSSKQCGLGISAAKALAPAHFPFCRVEECVVLITSYFLLIRLQLGLWLQLKAAGQISLWFNSPEVNGVAPVMNLDWKLLVWF